MIVLDTDVLTLVQRGVGTAYEMLAARLDEAHDTVAVTIISLEEQTRGWLAWIARAKTPERQIEAYRRLRALLEDFQTRPILDFDDAAVTEYRRLTKLKVRTGTMDWKIAAIVLANDALLVSRNLAHFRKVPDLEVEDWTIPRREP